MSNLDRYIVEANGNGTHSVRDTETGGLVPTGHGNTELTERDAHDLAQEYRYS